MAFSPITAGSLIKQQVGTDDTLVGSTTPTTLYGDAGIDILNHAVGGNDTITTFSSGSIYGDAQHNLLDNAAGGNDTLDAQIIASDGQACTINMYGDVGGALVGAHIPEVAEHALHR